MALIGFTVFKDKILDGLKDQTIRALRKNPPKAGEKLYLYWHLRQKDCEKLFETICTETFFIALEMDIGFARVVRLNSHPSTASQIYVMDGSQILDLAKRDGFDSATEMIQTLSRLCDIDVGRIFLQVIRWKRRT